MADLPSRFPPPKVVAIDIDGTLVRGTTVNSALVEWIRAKKSDGFEVMLWISRGVDYARAVAKRIGIENLFDTICSKPGFIVDDQGWSWIKFTKRITNLNDR